MQSNATLRSRIGRKMKRTLSNRNLKEKYSLDRIEENELLDEDDSMVDHMSHDQLKKNYILLKQKSLALRSFSSHLADENRQLKHLCDSYQHSKWGQDGDHFIRLQQTNAHLREQIEFLETNIDKCDKERAKMIFQCIHWGKFDNSTKGVLKIGKKSKSLFANFCYFFSYFLFGI